MNKDMLPIPTPEEAIENLRDDGFWPEAKSFENLLRKSRYHQQEIESLVLNKRESLKNQEKTYEHLLCELYQILGQFQDEIPEIVLDKIMAYIHGDYNGMFADEYPDLLPWYREKDDE